MKDLVGVTTLIMAFLMNPAFADHHMKDHMGKWDEKQMQMHNDEMEVHLQEMQALMDKLHATSDPAERRRVAPMELESRLLSRTLSLSISILPCVS
jgi:hypothetical protein